jgi:hypothetical protein
MSSSALSCIPTTYYYTVSTIDSMYGGTVIRKGRIDSTVVRTGSAVRVAPIDYFVRSHFCIPSERHILIGHPCAARKKNTPPEYSSPEHIPSKIL